MSDYFIPDSWAPHVVADGLGCTLEEAEALMREHEGDPEGFFRTMILWAARRDQRRFEELGDVLEQWRPRDLPS